MQHQCLSLINMQHCSIFKLQKHLETNSTYCKEDCIVQYELLLWQQLLSITNAENWNTLPIKRKQGPTILLHWFTLSLNGTGRWSGLDGGNKTFAINTSFSQCAVTIRFPSEIAWKIIYRYMKKTFCNIVVFTAVVTKKSADII